ncbi:MAG: helix-turn-helix transcriptional regulator [Fibrobacteria bacterium]|nr:helix-turn-helix transcriptional regulator [Fibrobacteria bacterium]
MHPKPLQGNLRKNIIQLIHQAGYRSFELFAHENGIDKSTVSRILAGSREPKVGTLDRIRQALEVDWNALLSDQPADSGANSAGPKL